MLKSPRLLQFKVDLARRWLGIKRWRAFMSRFPKQHSSIVNTFWHTCFSPLFNLTEKKRSLINWVPDPNLLFFKLTSIESTSNTRSSRCHHVRVETRYVQSLSFVTIAYRNIDGRKERVQFDKITARVSRLCYGLDPEHIDAAAITQKVISGVYQGVTTVELDNLVCLPFATLSTTSRYITNTC